MAMTCSTVHANLIAIFAAHIVGHPTLSVGVSPRATGNVSENNSKSRKTREDQVYRSILRGPCEWMATLSLSLSLA